MFALCLYLLKTGQKACVVGFDGLKNVLEMLFLDTFWGLIILFGVFLVYFLVPEIYSLRVLMMYFFILFICLLNTLIILLICNICTIFSTNTFWLEGDSEV